MNEVFSNIIKNSIDIINFTSSECNGMKYILNIVFVGMLFLIIKMRTITLMDRKHIVALVGSLLLLIRGMVLLLFEWGYKIKVYNDYVVAFLLPPLDHFFYMLGLGCLAYYTLNQYNYYPGILKKILWAIPTFMFMFFIYATIFWKKSFTLYGGSYNYINYTILWQSHSIIFIMCLYLFVVYIFNYKKYNIYLHIFWTIILIIELFKTSINFHEIKLPNLNIFINNMQIWSLPLLILHFVKAYVIRLGDCIICDRRVVTKENL